MTALPKTRSGKLLRRHPGGGRRGATRATDDDRGSERACRVASHPSFRCRRGLAAGLGASPSFAAAWRAKRPEHRSRRGWLVSEKVTACAPSGTAACCAFVAARSLAPPWFTGRLPHSRSTANCGWAAGASRRCRHRAPPAARWTTRRGRVCAMVFELPGAEGPFAACAQRFAAAGSAGRWPQLVAVEQSNAGLADGACSAAARRGAACRRRRPDVASRRCAVPHRPQRGAAQAACRSRTPRRWCSVTRAAASIPGRLRRVRSGTVWNSARHRLQRCSGISPPPAGSW